jgi:hypothetical protein
MLKYKRSVMYIALLSVLLVSSVLSNSSPDVSVDWLDVSFPATVYSVSVANDGSIYTTGFFTGNVKTHEYELTSKGAGDIFVAKYSRAGVLLWIVSAGGTANDVGKSVSAIDDGVYVTGWFTGSKTSKATFGAETLSGISANTDLDIFIAKYHSNGTLDWVSANGGESSDKGYSITGTTNGCLVTGTYNGKTTEMARFGKTEPYKKIYGYKTTSYSSDIFVAKFNSTGDVIWVKSAGSEITETATGISATSDGGAYVTGYVTGDQSSIFTFGSKQITGKNAASKSEDVFIAKYDSSGEVEWVSSEGGDKSDFSYGIATTKDDGAVITGAYIGSKESSTVKFGNKIIPGMGSTADKTDIFVVKYDKSGNIVWISTAGGAMADVGYSITAARDGGVYVTGSYGAAIDKPSSFDSFQLESSATTYTAGFIARYDKKGKVLWVQSAGSDNSGGIGYGISSGKMTGVAVVGVLTSGSDGSVKVGKTVATGLGSTTSTEFVVQMDTTQQTSCFGKDNESDDVCSGNGSCQSINRCICSDGWGGYKCQRKCDYCHITFTKL